MVQEAERVMAEFFDTAEARRALKELVKEIPEIQETLIESDERLKEA
jgi:hypothetical protein